jgi:hypothetical protein
LDELKGNPMAEQTREIEVRAALAEVLEALIGPIMMAADKVKRREWADLEQAEARCPPMKPCLNFEEWATILAALGYTHERFAALGEWRAKQLLDKLKRNLGIENDRGN